MNGSSAVRRPEVQRHPLFADAESATDFTQEMPDGTAVRYYTGPTIFIEPSAPPVAAGGGKGAVAISVSQEERSRDGNTWFELPFIGVHQGNERLTISATDARTIAAAMLAMADRVDDPGHDIGVQHDGQRSLAVWQTSACPTWCDGPHRDNDHPDDRRHHGSVDFTTMRRLRAPLMTSGTYSLPSLEVGVERHEHEAVPWVRITGGPDALGHDEVDLHLAIDEAQALASILFRAIEVAR